MADVDAKVGCPKCGCIVFYKINRVVLKRGGPSKHFYQTDLIGCSHCGIYLLVKEIAGRDELEIIEVAPVKDPNET